MRGGGLFFVWFLIWFYAVNALDFGANVILVCLTPAEQRMRNGEVLIQFQSAITLN